MNFSFKIPDELNNKNKTEEDWNLFDELNDNEYDNTINLDIYKYIIYLRY